jgi:hypothetical protein
MSDTGRDGLGTKFGILPLTIGTGRSSSARVESESVLLRRVDAKVLPGTEPIEWSVETETAGEWNRFARGISRLATGGILELLPLRIWRSAVDTDPILDVWDPPRDIIGE